MTSSYKIKNLQTVKSHTDNAEPAAKPTSVKIQAIMVLVMVTVGCIIYSNTIHSPFVFDDHGYILNDSACRMTRLSLDSIAKAALKGQPAHRMIPNISFALNYYFGRYDTFGYHLVNIFIHLMAGIFLFFFIKNTLAILYSLKNQCRAGPSADTTAADPALIAFFAALIWIVDPVQTQAVTYICQRMASMAAMFYILSLLLYVKGRMAMRADNTRRPAILFYFSGCIISGFCAVITKENTATLPFFILIYEWFFFQDLKSFLSKRRLMWVICMAVIFAGIAFFYLGDNPIRRILAGYTRRNFTMPQRVMTEWRVVIYYISLLIWPSPSRLNLDHNYPLSYSLIDPWTTLLCLIAIIGLIYTAVTSARKNRLLSFTIIWFLGNLVIESSIISIEIIFEHRTYLPFMMAVLMPVTLLFRNVRPRWLAVAFLCAVTTLFSIWTYQRNMVWQSAETFWRDCSSKSPKKFRPLNNYGIALFNDGKTDQAIIEYQKALQIIPEEPNALGNMGNALVKKNRIDEAISDYLSVLKINPNDFTTHNNLAQALEKKGLLDDAAGHYQKAIDIEPDNAMAHKRFGQVLFKLKKLSEAETQLKKAIELSPKDPEIYNMLGVVMVREKNISGAIAYFKKAIAIKPDYNFAKQNLSNVLSKQKKDLAGKIRGRQKPAVGPDTVESLFKLGVFHMNQREYDKAIARFQKALVINPKFINARYNLAIIYALKGKYGRSIASFKKIISIQPDNAASYYNIACIYARQNQKEKAIDWLKKAIDHGYDNWEHLKVDADLRAIRQTPYYQNLVKQERSVSN